MNQREAFEAWARVNHSRGGYTWMDDYNTYAYDDTRKLWECWQAAQQAKWLPIETAPRDGSPILVNWHGNASDSAVIVYWSNGWETGDSRQYEELQPDVWMPLPPEPKP